MEPDKIHFGTDGWRAIIADDYTFDNVRACAQGVAAYHIAQGLQADPVIVGYDTRFGSADFADAVVEVLAGNGLKVLRCTAAAPTPAVGYNLVNRGASGGIMITASHNPARWNGLKLRLANAAAPPPEVTSAIEQTIPGIATGDRVQHMPLGEAETRGLRPACGSPASPPV